MGNLTTNFSRREFACKCGCGCDDINPELVTRLQTIRDVYGPMTITSGVRCLSHNRAVGSKDNSAHVSGDGVDVACTDSSQRFRLVGLALAAGIKRIGVHKGFLHLDISPTLPPSVLWLY